jgi:hypothetical protein
LKCMYQVRKVRGHVFEYFRGLLFDFGTVPTV